MQVAIQATLIAAVTSTIITPLVQLVIDEYKRKNDYKARAASIIEHVRVLRHELLQVPLNPNLAGVTERILAIESFHDPVFNSPEHHCIKANFLDRVKYLEARHKQTRPWMEIEYPQECTILGNATERLLAVLNKDKYIPELFDPSE